MTYEEKFELANGTLMEIITTLIMYHITGNSKKCVEQIDNIVESYAKFRLKDLEEKLFGNGKKNEEV